MVVRLAGEEKVVSAMNDGREAAACTGSSNCAGHGVLHCTITCQGRARLRLGLG